MEFSYSTILGKITKKIDIAKFLYIHFYKKKLCNRLHAAPFSPTHKSQIPIGGGVGHLWHETNEKSRYGGDARADALSWVWCQNLTGSKLHRYLLPSRPRWLAMLAPHIPHRIGKKVASRKKSRLRRKKTRLLLAGQERVCRQVGELPFWVFSAPILWRRWPGIDFS